MANLKQCPFCGGTAEIDTMRGYRAYVSGDLGNAVAIYCRSCDADMVRCKEDMPGLTTDEILADLVATWNRRTTSKEPAFITKDAEIARLTALLDEARNVVGALIKVRPENWDDDPEDRELYEAWAYADVLLARINHNSRATND